MNTSHPPCMDLSIFSTLLDLLQNDNVEQLRLFHKTHPQLIERPLEASFDLFEIKMETLSYLVKLSKEPKQEPRPKDQPKSIAKPHSGFTALMLAVWVHAQRCFDFLLPLSDTRHSIEMHGNALSMAATCDFVHAVAPLLDRWEPSPTAQGESPERLPEKNVLLHRFAARSTVSLDLFKRVVAIGSPREIDAMGCTPLMLATRSGKIQWVRFLLPHSDLYVIDSCGHDALFYAIPHPHILQILLVQRDENPERLGREQALLTATEQAIAVSRDKGHRWVLLEKTAAQIAHPFEPVLESVSLLRARQERRELVDFLA